MKVEIRSDSVVLDGYVNAVGRDSRLMASPQGRFVEQVEPGTFQRAIERGPVELMFNHDKVVGSTADGTLELREDVIGLRATATVMDPEVLEAARSESLTGWSFGFTPLRDRWEDTDNGYQRRYLEDIRLQEVSILTKIPAYIATTIEQRDEETEVKEERNVEDLQKTETVAHTPGNGSNTAYKIRRLKIGGKRK